MSEIVPSVEINPPVQEVEAPVKDLLQKFDGIFYAMGTITAPTKFRGSEEQPWTTRPLFTRAKRAVLYKELKALPKENREGRKRIIEEAHLSDEITKQYLTQRELGVTLPGLGEQRARVINIVPPEPLQTEETFSKPPIFLIPGMSNDVDCVGVLIHELAMTGRRVIVIGYPESFKGHTTPEFAKAVEEDEGYGPHVAFYKATMQHFFGKDGKMELWGYSTGGPIVARILMEPEYQERTENAVLLCSASSVNQSILSLQTGLAHEVKFVTKKPTPLPYLVLTTESKTPREKEQIELRKKIMSSLFKKITKAYNYWKHARVQQGGHIIVVSGRNDKVTKSSEINDQLQQNPQIKLIDLEDGYHTTPGVEPAKIVPLIFDLQKAG